jgi:hypothetical protein
MDSIEQEFTNCLRFQSNLLHLLQHLNEAERGDTERVGETVEGSLPHRTGGELQS